MTTPDAASTEVSVPVGAALLVAGLLTWGAQFSPGIFAGWEVAVPIGGLWIALGALLFFPDMRLYRHGRSPIEPIAHPSDEESVDPAET